MAQIRPIAVTVTSGGTTSSAASLLLGEFIGMVGIPASWDGGDITFQMSPNGGTTWFDVYESDGKAADVCYKVTLHTPVASTLILTDDIMSETISQCSVRVVCSAVGADRIVTLYAEKRNF